jgi:hypothetical protein
VFSADINVLTSGWLAAYSAFTDRARGRRGLFEGIRHHDGNVLPEVVDGVVLERRTLFVNARVGSKTDAIELADVLARKDGSDAWHAGGACGIEARDAPFGHGGADRHRVQHAGQAEVRGVGGLSADFERAVNA